MNATSKILPVILSGGSGTRLWPLSRSSRPKQMLALVGENSLLADTAARTIGDAFAPPLVVAGETHVDDVMQAMKGTDFGGLIVEPGARNTAPAIALAAHWAVRDGADPLLLVMPSDHLVAKPEAFLQAIEEGRRAAEDGWLVTFGITPDRPETGYGYIERGERIAGTGGTYSASSFREKPDAATAAAYLASGDFSWNAGIFLMRASAFLAELQAHTPAIAEASAESMTAPQTDDGLVRPDRDAFLRSPSQSIDYAVMEPAAKKAVVPVEMGWSDIGAFDALHAVLRQDDAGNAIRGAVTAIDCRDSLLWSDGQVHLACAGMEDVVVVATGDVVAVVPKSRAQDVKLLVEALKDGTASHLT